jgi:hypothetical protein
MFRKLKDILLYLWVYIIPPIEENEESDDEIMVQPVARKIRERNW